MSDTHYVIGLFIIWAATAIGAIITATPPIYFAAVVATFIVTVMKGITHGQ